MKFKDKVEFYCLKHLKKIDPNLFEKCVGLQNRLCEVNSLVYFSIHSDYSPVICICVPKEEFSYLDCFLHFINCSVAFDSFKESYIDITLGTYGNCFYDYYVYFDEFAYYSEDLVLNSNEKLTLHKINFLQDMANAGLIKFRQVHKLVKKI